MYLKKIISECNEINPTGESFVGEGMLVTSWMPDLKHGLMTAISITTIDFLNGSSVEFKCSVRYFFDTKNKPDLNFLNLLFVSSAYRINELILSWTSQETSMPLIKMHSPGDGVLLSLGTQYALLYNQS